MELGELVAALYNEKPSGTLYHYTSIDGLLNIVQKKVLRATEIRYFNDSAELRHTAEIARIVIGHEYTLERLPNDPASRRLFNQFPRWLDDRLANGRMLFVSCFTGQGNLLSQWRGYCPPGKGVSLGFDAQLLCAAALNQTPSFMVGKCIYERNTQLKVMTTIVKIVFELAQKMGENPEVGRMSFQHVFEAIEGDLLQVAALLKNPSFREEEEWRAISPIFTTHSHAPVEFREGASTLVPFIRFDLPATPSGGLAFNEVVVGPTPRMESSINTVSMFLSKSASDPRFGVRNCEVPYRTW